MTVILSLNDVLDLVAKAHGPKQEGKYGVKFIVHNAGPIGALRRVFRMTEPDLDAPFLTVEFGEPNNTGLPERNVTI